MSIATEISRIAAAKSDLRRAINAKGGTIAAADKLGTYAAQVDALEPAEFGNRVRFFDYDGTLLKTVYVADGEDAAPPTDPVHTGLTFTGWNNDYTDVSGDIDCGAMYTPTSGKTEIDLRTLVDERNYTLKFTITSGTLTVNWGDGTSADTVTATGTLAHTYMVRGTYTITIAASSGAVWQPGNYFCNGGSSDSEYCTQAVRFSGITSIPEYALRYCRSLRAVVIPDGVTTVGNYAFYGCYALRAVVIPDGVTTMGYAAFYECYGLACVVWPASCVSVPEQCFYYCRSLAGIVLPSGVTGIVSSAFYDCYSLAEAYIPDTVTSIGGSAFSECYALSTLHLPAGITALSEYVFRYCYALRAVVIPPSVTTIGVRCFQYCYGLRSVVIPEGVTRIYDRVFESCYGITSVTLPSTLTRVDYYAFYGCPLKNITIPAAVTYIGSGAFYSYGLLDVSVLPTTPPTADGSDIFGSNSNRRITVPAASLTDYKGATNWSAFADNIFAAS